MSGPINDDGGEGFYTALKERKADELDKKPDSKTDDEEESLKRYRPTIESKTGKTKGKGFFSKKKAATILGGLGLVGAIAALAFSLLQGPLQFLQLANTAQRLYSHVDDVFPDRGGKLIRYLNNRNSPENRRLGVIGNRVTDKIRTKLEVDGMKLNINDAGYLESINYKGRNIPLGDSSNSIRRAEFKAVLKDLGYGKITTALVSRPIFQKFGIDLKPFGNIKRRANESVTEFKNRVREQKDVDINEHIRYANCSECEEIRKNLEDERSKTTDQQDRDRINRLEAELKSALADAELNTTEERRVYNETEGTQADKTKAAGGVIRSKINRAGSIIGVVGLAFCTVNQIGEDIVAGERSKVETIMNLGAEANAMAAQMKAGTGGVNLDELAVSAERFDDPTGNSWMQSNKVNYVISGENKGVEQSPATIVGTAQDNNMVKIASVIDGPDLPILNLDNICAALGNIIVQGILTTGEFVLAFFTGGATAIIGQAVEEVVSEVAAFFISDAASGYVAAAVGDPIPAMISGPDYGAVVMTGNYINSNILAMENGGRNLSNAETLELVAYLNKQESFDNEYKNIAEKYLDINQPTTLVGSLYASTVNGSYENPLRSPDSIIDSIASSLMKPFSKKVFAQSPNEVFDGIQQIGYAVDEFNGTIANQDPFENERILYQTIGGREKVDQAVEDCINEFPTLSDTDTDNRDYLNPSTPSECPYRGNNQQDKNILLRLRLYAMDINVLNSLGCISGDNTSCNEMGLGNSSETATTPQAASSGIIGDPLADSTDISCADGTKNLGIYDAYVQGEKIPSRMCSITGFKDTGSSQSYIDGAEGFVIVNSRVSGAVLAMYEQAKTDGVELASFSSFRSHEHQQDLFANCAERSNCTPGTHVARPGYSSHENGTAIDFAGVSGKASGRTCETRIKDTSNETWLWLEANARDFGYKQYVNEAWHWDTLESSSRC